MISIHVPNAGNDTCVCDIRERLPFQSTFPMQGTTLSLLTSSSLNSFQSTFPMQGTTGSRYDEVQNMIFQSTFPMQGTTLLSPILRESKCISIHVPNAGNDR